jgi:SpoVK/Ycf46/Vps4 family AAA+-type ATPase
MREARDLIIMSAPDEVEFTTEKLVCTPRQEETIRKIQIALANREYLRDRGIYEFGRLLFVGPPGTGKTSLALAMSNELHMPVLEVRLAMVTSQYLGETSKNIDRVFELAKKVAPSILFIDEFDYVAKSRISDDHGAMKRAVNMLLKNIDQISFIRDGVLLIGATNHPGLLDEAAWRRFDEVVEFPLPDHQMRKEILQKVTATVECVCDFDDLASRTEGFSGADLRIMMKEAIISALMRDQRRINQEDIERGLLRVEERNLIRRSGTP